MFISDQIWELYSDTFWELILMNSEDVIDQ